MSPSVEERLAVVETKLDDYIVHDGEYKDELMERVKCLDTKVGSILIREAERKGETQEFRRIAAKVSAFVSIIVGAIASVLSGYFK